VAADRRTDARSPGAPTDRSAVDHPVRRRFDAAVATIRANPLLQLVLFASVGGLFNVLYGLLYVVLRNGLDAQWANAIALIASTIAGTAGHRRVTFGVRGTEKAVQHQGLGLGLLGFSLAVTAGSLWLLDALADHPSRLAELAVLTAANLGVGLVRFLAFRVSMVPEPAHPQA
jgi:putative flippase GtrA